MSATPSPDYVGVYEQDGLYFVKIYLTAELIPLSLDPPQRWATPALAADMYNIYAYYLDYLLADLNGGIMPQRYYNGDFTGIARDQIPLNIKMHMRDMLDDLNQSNPPNDIKTPLLDELLHAANLECVYEIAVANSRQLKEQEDSDSQFMLEQPGIIDQPPPFLPSNPLASAADTQEQLKKAVGIIITKHGHFRLELQASLKSKRGGRDILLKLAISPTLDETWGTNELEAGKLYDQCILYLDMLIKKVGYLPPIRRLNLRSSKTLAAESLVPLEIRVRVMALLNARKMERPEEMELLENLRAAAQLDVANLSATQSSSSSSLATSTGMLDKFKKTFGVFESGRGYYQIKIRAIIEPKTGDRNIDLKFTINPYVDETWGANKLEAGKLYDQYTLYLDMLIKNVGYTPPSRKHYNLSSSLAPDAARFVPLEVRELVLGLLNARTKDRPEEIELLEKMRAAAQLDIESLLSKPSSSSSSSRKKPKYD